MNPSCFGLRLTDVLSLWCVSLSYAKAKATCWVKLNMDAMRKEYQSVRSKRIALGKTD